MDATEGLRDVGDGTRAENRLKNILALVRKSWEEADDWAGGEFDGIRSHADFRRAMALEAERSRGSWSRRALRALSTVGANLWNSRALRLLR
jgi:hypothetical protein